MRVLALSNLYPNPIQPHRAAFNRLLFGHLAGRMPLRAIAPIAWVDEWDARRRGRWDVPADRRVERDGLVVDHPSYLYPPRVLRGSYGACFYRSVRPAFRRAVAEFRPDLVLAAWAYPDGWAAVRLGREHGLPVVLKIHGSDILGVGDHPGRRRGTVEALRGVDEVVSVGRRLAARAVELGADPGRTRVIHEGIDLGLFRPGDRSAARESLGLPRDGAILLSVGNLLPVKGCDILLEAARRLGEQGVAFRLFMIGLGPLEATLRTGIDRLGLADRVTLVGAVAHDRLAEWYRAADLFVLPSRSEGIPNVLREAIACGLPFAASDVGGVAEVAPPGASVLVPPEDPARLAEAIRGALGGSVRPPDPATLGLLGHDDVAAEFARCFEDVLRRRGGPVAADGGGEVLATASRPTA